MFLFVNYFRCKDSQRQNELDTCLRNNTACTHIQRIVCVVDGTAKDRPILKHDKIEVILFGNRPTYSDLFRIIKTSGGAINCIANADVFFNESLRWISRMQRGECWALSRWDYVDGKLVHVNRRDSQDAWIFHGAPQIEANFHLGIPGCDNRIAWEFSKVFNMRNPSLSIQMIHLHQTQQRPYFTNGKVSVRIPQPYAFVPAHTI